jgi:hypothetical protein
MKAALPFALLFFLTTQLFAQQVTLSGKITDEQNHAIPYASVYVKGTTKGTSANAEGNYTLQLNTGQFTIVFKAVGFKLEKREVGITGNQTMNMVLQTESYQLKDVVVKIGAEDPAYAIIRKAQKKRKYYLNQVNAFTCDVYTKGMQKILSAPKKLLGVDIQKAAPEIGLDSNRRGILYLSEAESKYSFQKPNQVHEEMVSSKVSGTNRGFSLNRASNIDINFYENIQNWANLSYRPLISPIAENAFFYYNYKYIGFTVENGENINKIQVTPKRGYDACFTGYIYIVDDSWRLYGLDLYITKKQNINFMDTIRLSQQYLPVDKDVWMPTTNKFEFVGGFFNIKIGGYYILIYKDYDIHPNFNKKDFKEVLKITKGVNKKDSVFWENERPIPLTEEEKKDYKKKEVLAKKRESKTYLDSLDKVNNKFSANGFFNNGYHHRNRFKHEFYDFKSIRNAFGFNTIEGANINYDARYSKRIDSNYNRYFILGGNARYGFANKNLNGYLYSSLPTGSFTTLTFAAGSTMLDINSRETISPLVNSIYSLFLRENRLKLYQKQFINFNIDTRIIGGWKANGYLSWGYRTWLPNSSNFSFFHPSNHEYTSNNPFTPAQETPLFPSNRMLKVTLSTTYDFSDKYETYPNGRRYLPSPYPTIGLYYSKGINGLLGSQVDYDLISADITKTDIDDGIIGQSSFYIGAGKFLNANKLYYPDYAQFGGNQLLFYKSGINNFLLLNYYTYSTKQEYLEAHFEQNFSGFFLNKIPLIRKMKLKEIVDVNYLSTPDLMNYTEFGIGVQYLGLLRVMYGTSYRSGNNIHQGFRIGLSF